MQTLTLGQRIASCRKLKGLSQEALAEQMLVSRQAVSKWESDATIPEIDKLIALSKLYGVSVGYLLGVESEETTQVGFNDEQLRAVEELISKYIPPKRTRWARILAVCCFFFILLITLYCKRQIQILHNSNADAISKISSLTEDNLTLQSQLSDMHKLLSQFAEDSQLLTDFFWIQTNADESLKNVSTRLYMKPKVYQEKCTAYLTIQNPNTKYNQTVACVWDPYNQVYVADYTVPAVDGFKITFLLVNEYGYKEENLLLRDAGFTYTGTFCTFHLDPDSSQFTRMLEKKPTCLNAETIAMYSFDEPIYTPHIFAKTAVAYKDIRIVMLHNGETIWEESFLDAFHQAAGGNHLNAGSKPVHPSIQLDLSEHAAVGDRFELILTAETVNGGEKVQSYYTLLDNFQIVAS